MNLPARKLIEVALPLEDINRERGMREVYPAWASLGPEPLAGPPGCGSGAGGGAEMKPPITIHVRDFTGGPVAVSAEDGQRLHDAIAQVPFKEGKPVVLSFAGIETIIAAFLGAAVGRLHGEMAYEDVDALLLCGNSAGMSGSCFSEWPRTPSGITRIPWPLTGHGRKTRTSSNAGDDTGMKLSKIEITNFRCFESVSVKLQADINVFVGVNGAGKTTILDAIAITLYEIVVANGGGGKQERAGQKVSLRPTDIHVTPGSQNTVAGRKEFVSIKAEANEYYEVSGFMRRNPLLTAIT